MFETKSTERQQQEGVVLGFVGLDGINLRIWMFDAEPEDHLLNTLIGVAQAKVMVYGYD